MVTPYTAVYVIPKVVSPTVVGTADYVVYMWLTGWSGGSCMSTLSIPVTAVTVVSLTVGSLLSNGPTLKESTSE